MIRVATMLVLLAAALGGCGSGDTPPATAAPTPDTSGMERRVIEAIAAARSGVAQTPESAAAWGRMGVACQVHGLHGPADTCYRRAAGLAPADPRWPYFRAIALHAQFTDDELVIELFEAAVAMRPDDAAIRVRLGDALSAFGRREAAAESYRAAIEWAPGLARAHFALGRLLVTMDDARGAITQLERADDLMPRHGAIRAALAQAYARAGRTDDARSMAASTGDIAVSVPLPDPLLQELADAAVSSEQCMERAIQHMTRGRFDLAVRDLQIVEEVRTDDAAVHLHLGASLHRLGRLDEAERHLRRAVAIDDTLAPAQYRLGALLLDTGRRDESIAALSRARRLDPADARTAWKLAAALAVSGRVDEALSEFDAAGVIGGGKARDHLNWGIALLERGRPAEAQTRLETSLRLDPGNADTLCMMGRALEVQGRSTEARQMYEAALQRDPDNNARRYLDALR